MTNSSLRATAAQPSASYIVPLDEATLPELAGGKAHNLYRVLKLGLRVPTGFVVTTRAFETHLEENDLAVKIQALSPAEIHDLIVNTSLSPKFRKLLGSAAEELLNHGPVVVRSSAVGEDSARGSFAGQLDSFLHVRTFAELESALLACWASCWSERAIAYRAARGFEVRGMGVVIQTQVDALAAGVLFTRTAEGTILVEHTSGLGDELVSGAVDPGRFVLHRNGNGFLALSTGERPIQSVENLLFSPARLAELARLATKLEEGLGGPQDVEWAIDRSGLLYIVQSRPITATLTVRAAPPDGPPVRWSDANVNENFPAPISPFLYSIASAGYAHYFLNLARAFGLSKTRIAAMDDALRHIIGAHGARMYYNLTNIHTVLRTAPFGDALVAAFNSFVGAGGSFGTPARSRTTRLRELVELAVIAAKVAWLYLFLGRRVASFERLVDDFAERTEPHRLAAMSLRDLRLLLNELMDIRCHRWTNASLADAASMVCYAVLRRLVQQANDGKASGAHNTLLKAIPQLVSGEPVQQLWEISRAVRADATLRALFERDAETVINQISMNPELAGFRARFEEYLQRWGFRCSAELMLTVPSFQEQPALLVDTIRAYAHRACESPAEALSRQLAEREQETRSLLRKLRGRPIRAAVLRNVLRCTHAAIAHRERARLKQALLYSRCRRLALALGDRFVARGHLAEREDVFWLTVAEVDELAAGNAMFPHHVQELTAMRKRAHERLATTQPKNDFTLPEGEYLPLDEDLQTDAHANTGSRTLRGVGACGGRVTGRAVVLRDASEAGRLGAEDILVTRQTDPGWASVFFLIKGLVIERGGMLSHGAIVAREFGIPCVVGVQHATRELVQAGQIEVDGDRGEVHVLDEIDLRLLA
jgi:rifampicin phosphotransferase